MHMDQEVLVHLVHCQTIMEFHLEIKELKVVGENVAKTTQVAVA